MRAPFLPSTQNSALSSMFALHFSPTARPILTSEDHALLALIVEERFTLPHIVANYEAAHPARQSLLTLTRWLKLPHIDTALKTLIADLREYESIRHEFLQRHSIDGLVDSMHSASRNLKLLEEARTHNPQHTRAVEELRLAAQALNRATKPGGTPSRGTVPAPRGRAASESCSADPYSDQCDSASRATDPSSGQCESTSSLHREAVEANRRGSWRSHTPGKITPNTSTRSPDAPASDNNSLSTDLSSHQCESTSSLHREAVEANRRGSWRSHTPGENPQNTSTRSLDALTSDNNSLTTDSSSDPCVSASLSPQSGARNEPGASAPGTETSHITLPSSFLSTEGAPHSTRSPDAPTSDNIPSPSTPRHLDTSTPSSLPLPDS